MKNVNGTVFVETRCISYGWSLVEFLDLVSLEKRNISIRFRVDLNLDSLILFSSV